MFDRLRRNTRQLARQCRHTAGEVWPVVAVIAAWFVVCWLRSLSGAVVAVDPPAGAVRVVRADFGLSIIIPTIISLLGNLFGWKHGKVDSSTLSAITSLRSTVVDMGKTFLSGMVDVAGKLAAMIGTFIRFIQKTFGKLYDMLAKVVTRIARILDRIFGPIIDVLNKLRAHLQKFYDKVLKPIIDTIEMVRGFVRLLSFFGIDWAKKLDVKLAELEQYILAPYEFLVTKLNEAMNWINRIVTLDGFLQRVMLLNSLIRDVAYTNNLWWNTNHQNASPAKRGQYGQKVQAQAIDTAVNDTMNYIIARGGPQRAKIDEAVEDVRLQWRRVGIG